MNPKLETLSPSNRSCINFGKQFSAFTSLLPKDDDDDGDAINIVPLLSFLTEEYIDNRRQMVRRGLTIFHVGVTFEASLNFIFGALPHLIVTLTSFWVATKRFFLKFSPIFDTRPLLTRHNCSKSAAFLSVFCRSRIKLVTRSFRCIRLCN